MKDCSKCLIPKEEGDFYRGMKKCKECHKAFVRTAYRKNIEANRDYEKKRFQDPVRRAAAQRYQEKRRAKNPEKYRARTAVGNAIRDGRLKREPCEVCGQKAQAHHEDYQKPLEVRWLCFKHHRAEHGQETA